MATINRDELQAIRNHVGNIPTVAGMYAAALIAWCEALLRELDCGQDGVCAATP